MMHPAVTLVNEYTINGMSSNHFLMFFCSIHGNATNFPRSMKYINVNNGNNAIPNAIFNRFFVICFRFVRPSIAMATVESTGAVYKTSLQR
jgi:hypothetical protein